MRSLVSKFQIGKNGMTGGVIESLNLALKNHRQVRVSVLKSSGRNREKMSEFVSILENALNYKCRYKIIGFTIVIVRLSMK